MYKLATLTSILMLSVGLTTSLLAQGKGKGKNQSTPYSFTLEMVNDANTDGFPNYGDTVKFNGWSTGQFVSVSCYQGTAWVYAAGGYPAGSNFALASNSWPGGAADCTATLYTTTDGARTNTVATLSFHVSE